MESTSKNMYLNKIGLEQLIYLQIYANNIAMFIILTKGPAAPSIINLIFRIQFKVFKFFNGFCKNRKTCPTILV